jgi:ribonucleotide monophosphatase NagD (HAD superfamily)
VLSHTAPKPHSGCADSIMSYFSSRPELGVTHPCQVAIVGDRLLTDIYLANTGGFYGLWVRDGVVQETGLVGMVCSCNRRSAAKKAELTRSRLSKSRKASRRS